jgi:hypothetical protein
MSPHQGCEGGLIALRREALQELRIRRLGDTGRPRQLPDVLKDNAGLFAGHGLGSRRVRWFFHL